MDSPRASAAENDSRSDIQVKTLKKCLSCTKNGSPFLRYNIDYFVFEDAAVVFAELFFDEFHFAVGKGEKCMIPAHSDIHAGVELGSALAHDDAAGFYRLAPE